MEQTVSDSLLFFVLGILLIFLVIFVLIAFTEWLIRFRKELKILTGEIYRTEGWERKYWIRKRRKLWLSLLPFVRY